MAGGPDRSLFSYCMDIKASARRYSRLIGGLWFPAVAAFPLLLTLDIAPFTPEQTRAILAIALPSLGIGGAILGWRAMHREWTPTLTMAAIWGCSSISTAYIIALLVVQLLVTLLTDASDWFLIPLLLEGMFTPIGSRLITELLIIGSVSGLLFNRALAGRGDSSLEGIAT